LRESKCARAFIEVRGQKTESFGFQKADPMLRVGIKYCGGCNPGYDRVALLDQLAERLAGRVEFIAPPDADVDLILAIEGCKTACADLSPFQGKTISVITHVDDAEKYLQERLN